MDADAAIVVLATPVDEREQGFVLSNAFWGPPA
jgi:hypothetical protein